MKFSIITCTRNSAQYLQENINSIKNQTCQDFEHIFIDGFSTDDTVEIIKKYQEEFPTQVRLLQFKPLGISSAMNEGIKAASGEYINHLHSDDSLHTNTILAEVFDFIEENNKPDLIYGKANFFNPENGVKKIIPHRRIYHNLKFWLLLLTNYIPHQAVFIKKAVFSKFGLFDETLKNSMDYELWVRLAKNKVSNKFMDVIICNFSMREDAQSAIGKGQGNKENGIIQKKYISSKFLLMLVSVIRNINNKRTFFE
jgi:glycosyltransferase involved in cell wall biosynthesis